MSALKPNQWLGMLGGGQLGRMFAFEAQRLGFRVMVLDPDPQAPAASVAHRHLQAAFTDETALAELATHCASISTEFENVPASSLEWLARRTRVSPNAWCVGVAQDRIVEKRTLKELGVAVAPHAVIESPADLTNIPSQLFPGLLKTARLGYDGKGQIRINSSVELTAAWHELKQVPCVLEARLPLAAECSIVLARGFDGQTVCYPLVTNEHRSGILHRTQAPSDLESRWPGLEARARSAALQVAQGLGYHGVLCVEFFVLADGTLLANEIAPRPHNSGHWTLNAALCSQFEQQVRVMAGLPLGATERMQPAVMINLLGDLWQSGEPPWTALLELPGSCLHLYGKTEARAGRKMGHITFVGPDAMRSAQAAELLLGLNSQGTT